MKEFVDSKLSHLKTNLNDEEKLIINEVSNAFQLILKGMSVLPINLPDNYSDNELSELVNTINTFIIQYNETSNFINSISKGNLEVNPPKNNLSLTYAIKHLNMSLKHLSWKAQKIALGDFSQRIDFLGDFSDAFNSMTLQLKDSFNTINLQKKDLEEYNQIIQKERDNLEQIVQKRTQELKDLLISREAFFRNINHELRTPLNGIIGFVDLMLAFYTNQITEKQKEYLQIIKESATNLLNLINDLIDLCALLENKKSFLKQKINLDKMLSGLFENYKSKLEEKNISISCELDDKTIQINYDEKALKQILIHFLLNAIKFNIPNGTILIKTERLPSGNVRLSCIDSGIGIDNNETDNLFDTFYKSSITEKQAIQGMGIGLAVCKKLVEIEDGTIGAYKNDDSGSTFWFEIKDVIN